MHGSPTTAPSYSSAAPRGSTHRGSIFHSRVIQLLANAAGRPWTAQASAPLTRKKVRRRIRYFPVGGFVSKCVANRQLQASWRPCRRDLPKSGAAICNIGVWVTKNRVIQDVERGGAEL